MGPAALLNQYLLTRLMDYLVLTMSHPSSKQSSSPSHRQTHTVTTKKIPKYSSALHLKASLAQSSGSSVVLTVPDSRFDKYCPRDASFTVALCIRLSLARFFGRLRHSRRHTTQCSVHLCSVGRLDVHVGKHPDSRRLQQHGSGRPESVH